MVRLITPGTVVEDDFRDHKVADQWFQNKYNLKLHQKDLEATSKYRFDEKFSTGGTFGVNYAGMGGKIMAFNYRTIFDTEEARLDLRRLGWSEVALASAFVILPIAAFRLTPLAG